MTRQHIVILGCGKIARLHAKLIGRYRDHIDLSFASRSPDRAEQYRRKFRGRGAFASYGDACEDSTVDVVVDCTPPSQHIANAERAALHHKTLIVEKPLARNLEEMDRIAKIVADAGVLAMVAENYRFKPLLIALRHHIERGDIGTPLFYGISRAGKSVKTGWRADPEEMGGGALLEGGVHWVNLLVELGGTPQAAVAMRPTLDYSMSSPFEDCLELLVRFRTGAVGRLFHSWATTSRVAGLGLSRILGTEGNIHFESNGLFALVLGRRTRLRFPGVRDLMGYRGMWRHFIEVLDGGVQPLTGLGVIRRDLAVVEAAYRSLESERIEPIGE
jgi:predicted dehydrogenase